ncbi:MAG: hypothetical protein EOO93_18640, partial [Pedobacter sp.]
MKKLLSFLVIFISITPVVLRAQESDTSSNSGKISSNFYTDSIQLLKLNFAKKSAYYLNLLPEKVSMAKGEFGYQKGLFIPSQGSTGTKFGQF